MCKLFVKFTVRNDPAIDRNGLNDSAVLYGIIPRQLPLNSPNIELIQSVIERSKSVNGLENELPWPQQEGLFRDQIGGVGGGIGKVPVQ